MKTSLVILTALTCLNLLHGTTVFAANEAVTASDSDSASAASDKGGASGNGGNVIKSISSETRFLDLVRKASKIPYTPKTKRAYQTLTAALAKNPGYQEATILQPLVGFSKNPKTRVFDSLDRLKFLLINEPLPALDDTGVISLMQNFKGVMKRLALQNRTTGQVLVDINLLEELLQNDADEVGVAAFFLHEALIRIFYDGDYYKTLTSTEIISSIVNVTFGENKILTQWGAEDLAQILTQTGIPTTGQTLPALQVIPMNRSISNDPQLFETFYAHFESRGMVKKCKGNFKQPKSIKAPSGTIHFMMDIKCPSTDGAQMMDGGFDFTQFTRVDNYPTDITSVYVKDTNGAPFALASHFSPDYGNRNSLTLWIEIKK